MPSLKSREWTLASRPVGMPKLSDFQHQDTEAPEPSKGEIQVQNSWMSVDPYMRGRMYDRESYVPPFQIGEVLQGHAVGTVTASHHPDYSKGDLVTSMAGWREAWTADPSSVMANKMPKTNLPDSALLGVAGMPGLTAYAGILRVADLQEGDTVFVSGAAGAVGSTVVQIAKIKNCTVIGSAGGEEKCKLVKKLGADHVIDYKQHDSYEALLGALKGAAPKGIDVYFDNVGGDHLQAAIEAARPMARFAICGMISQYNATEPQPGPYNIIQVVGKQLTLRGFIVGTHVDMQPQFLQDMAKWIESGQMKFEETVMEGIENAPEAFLGLFQGRNTGKMLVKLG
ncbi:NADP-dependent oxidoreductase [Henriciella sp.]|uniref:NADP-dependent oxidoreductase n=1 Tax=Henriciella sp. TaxID=1968823 RepID=UPI00262698EF|nr:NADP-dependent oxidoreductase [Henriciella sp.]